VTEVCAIEYSDGVPGIQDPSFDGGGVGVGGRPTRHGYPSLVLVCDRQTLTLGGSML
jgi:hypothetical protein